MILEIVKIIIIIIIIKIILIIYYTNSKKKEHFLDQEQVLEHENLVSINNKFLSLIGKKKIPSVKNCICVMCIKPQKIWIDFLLRIKKKHNYDIYLVVDDNSIVYEIKDINIIQIGDIFCKNMGFMNANYLVKNNEPSVWDKMFLYFSYNNIYENYWILENDVFVPTIDTINNIDKKYQSNDLLCKSNNIKQNDNNLNWHWTQMKFKNKFAFELPWYKSMVCAVRIPNIFFVHCKNSVLKNKRLFFLEFFINTLANKNNIKCNSIPELSEIHYRKNYTITDFEDENKLYHPVKDIFLHQKIRDTI